MSIFEQNKDFYNFPVRLEKEEQDEPYEIIRSFCGAYHLYEIRQHLWNFLEIAVTTENDVFDQADSRNNIFLFHHQLEEAIEAIYIINLIRKSYKESDYIIE